nr:unnamed protein product [Callosobruchus analis]
MANSSASRIQTLTKIKLRDISKTEEKIEIGKFRVKGDVKVGAKLTDKPFQFSTRWPLTKLEDRTSAEAGWIFPTSLDEITHRLDEEQFEAHLIDDLLPDELPAFQGRVGGIENGDFAPAVTQPAAGVAQCL